MNEKWRDIKGYEGIYQVSDQGRVRSLDRIDARGWHRKERILRMPLHGGYPSVSLCKNGTQTSGIHVHRLVAEAFLGECPTGCEISHKDNLRDNNRVDNLEYVTHRDNMINSAREAKLGHILSAEKVQELRALVAENPRISIHKLTKMFGAERHVIYDVLSCRGYAHVPNRDGSEAEPFPANRSYYALSAEEILAMRDDGMSMIQIAKKYDANTTMPYQVLYRAGIRLSSNK